MINVIPQLDKVDIKILKGLRKHQLGRLGFSSADWNNVKIVAKRLNMIIQQREIEEARA